MRHKFSRLPEQSRCRVEKVASRMAGISSPMNDERELAFMPAWKQAQMVATGEVSPVELVELYLRRIEQIDPKVGAYITVAAEQARAAARQAQEQLAGSRRGGASSTPATGTPATGPGRRRTLAGEKRNADLPPLFGVPVSLKDIEATKGIRTTLGSRIFADTVPDFDSVVSERVRASGAILIGKTNTPEIAIHLETITDNEVRGPCRNPWDLNRATGGSSGGAAAALATGMCALAVGSDGGGSIRIPAAWCGVFGIKPTQGRVPRARGLARPDPNQFAQSGPMSNNVLDSAILLQALSGPDPRDPQPYLREPAPDFVSAILRQGQGGADSRPLRGLRVGWTADLGHAAVDPEMAEVCAAAASVLASLGAEVETAEVKFSPDLSDHFWNVFGANAYLQFGHWLDDPAKAALMGHSARTALERGKSISGHAYARSLRAVNELRLYVDGLLEKYNLLLTPTTAIPAFDPKNRPQQIAGKAVNAITGFYPFTFPFNMTGHPAATVPCGFVNRAPERAAGPLPSPRQDSAGGRSASPGLPAGLHVIGRRGDDAGVLFACAAFETARPWSGTRPMLA